MTKLASLFILAALAFTTAADAQETAGTASHLSRPSPSPNASQKPAAEAAGKPEAMLATDEKGKDTATTFAASTKTIHLVTKNISGAKGDKIEVLWTADDTGKALPKGKKLAPSAVVLPDAKSYNPSFHVDGPVNGTFPTGKYHVDLTVGGKVLKSLKFTVK